MNATEDTMMKECMTVSGDAEISVKTAMIKGKVFLASGGCLRGRGRPASWWRASRSSSGRSVLR